MGCKNSEPETAESIVEDFIESYQSRYAISFKGQLQMKFFSNPNDTNKWQVKVDLIRDIADTLLGGMLWIEADSTIRYWNTERAYIIDHGERKITQYPDGKVYIITGNSLGDIRRVYFFKPEKLRDLLEDTTYSFKLWEDSLFNKEQWVLNVDIPADEYLSGGWKRIWLDKQDLTVRQTRSSYDMQGENQFRERRIDEVSFDQVDSSALEARFEAYLEEYELEIYQPPEERELAPLDKGESFPSVRGWSYNLEDTLDLEGIDARLVVLDFWYMDCHPCIMAIPHLNELAGNYSREDLAIIGVNPFNNNEKDLERLPNFLEHNPIDYPFVFVDRDMATDAKVRGYPTFYVLNEDRKVVYSGVGYSDELSSRLDSVLGVHLGNE